MLAGYFMQVAHLERTGHYLTVKDNQVCDNSAYALHFRAIYSSFVANIMTYPTGCSFTPFKLPGP